MLCVVLTAFLTARIVSTMVPEAELAADAGASLSVAFYRILDCLVVNGFDAYWRPHALQQRGAPVGFPINPWQQDDTGTPPPLSPLSANTAQCYHQHSQRLLFVM